jgi:hypothetical protein
MCGYKPKIGDWKDGSENLHIHIASPWHIYMTISLVQNTKHACYADTTNARNRLQQIALYQVSYRSLAVLIGSRYRLVQAL